MNTDYKILNYLPENQISEHKEYTQQLIIFLLWTQGWLNIYKSKDVLQHINRLKDEAIWPSQCTNMYDKIQNPFLIKAL